MAAERERGHDPEVPSPAADRPEQIRLALGVGLHDRAVGEHHRRGDEVVDREPERSAEVADAAAERQPADAGRADDPDRDVSPCWCVASSRSLSRTPPPARAIDARRIDADVVHLREIDHEPVVDRAQAAAVVAAAAHRDPEAVLDAVAQRRGDVRLVGAVGDRSGPLVDHPVVEGARLVVVSVGRLDDTAFHRGRETLD